MSFRAKLLLLVGMAGMALILLVAFDAYVAGVEEKELERIEATYLPLLELAPQVSAQMERLRRAFQDAATAADDAPLEDAQAARDTLIAELERARAVLPAGDAAALQLRVDRYFEAGMSVTRRMIAGETGQAMVDDLATMQRQQKQAAEALARATTFDRQRLGRAFESLRHTRTWATTLRIGVALSCLLLVLVLSAWIGGRVLGALDELARGFVRFGSNELTTPIRVISHDEVGEVARQANLMAERLHELVRQHTHSAWLATGQAELGRAIEGELSVEEIGQRALTHLTDYVAARVAILHSVSDGRPGACIASHGVPCGTLDASQAGVLALAIRDRKVIRVDELPEGYLHVATGLGRAAPRSVWVVPIAHVDGVVAIMELGLLGPAHEACGELLEACRRTLAVALHAAMTRAARHALLQETQLQAQRLTLQEEELRTVNDELVRQAAVLEVQKQVLAERNVEVEAARERLQKQTVQLESASRYKSQFLANMSHELRTPLNSMLVLSDLLARNEQKNLSDKQVEFASIIHAAGQDLLGLINQVLDLAKIEAGKLDVRPLPLSLRELVSHLLRVYSPLASGKGLELRVELAPDVPQTIVSDRARIEQVLTNLIGNAIKFTDRGSVSITVQRGQGDSVAFAVRDTGIGIAERDLGRIFAAFEQADGGAQRRHGGTGLGLSIARHLAQLLGGELHVTSEPGKGSCFTLEVSSKLGESSVSRASIAEPQPQPQPASMVRESTVDAGYLRELLPRSRVVAPNAPALLIIEDDLGFAERVAELANDRGLNALIAQDGASGVELARAKRPRGVVLDVRLPDMDGYEVFEQLRALPGCGDLPIHFVSCIDRQPDRALGAVGYLRKPASQEDLMNVFERLAPSAARRVLVVEDDSKLSSSLASLLSAQGLEAVCAPNGHDGLAALHSQSFACMVLDLGLPDIDGLEVLERMQSDDSLPKVPVIVYTGRPLSEDETKRLQTYAAGIVLKNASTVDRLVDELRGFVERLGQSRSDGPEKLLAQGGSLEGKKVLVADDDMRTAYALSALLRGKGANVLVADTGRAAVDMLAAEARVDAVIMDVMMPEMDGYEAMREIRKTAQFQGLPIIALTAKAMKDDRTRCIEAGASDYMAKPVDGQRLLTVLRAWLSAGV